MKSTDTANCTATPSGDTLVLHIAHFDHSDVYVFFHRGYYLVRGQSYDASGVTSYAYTFYRRRHVALFLDLLHQPGVMRTDAEGTILDRLRCRLLSLRHLPVCPHAIDFTTLYRDDTVPLVSCSYPALSKGLTATYLSLLGMPRSHYLACDCEP